MTHPQIVIAYEGSQYCEEWGSAKNQCALRNAMSGSIEMKEIANTFRSILYIGASCETWCRKNQSIIIAHAH